MADIIDIIHRLSYEVKNDELQQQIKIFNDLNKQATQYEESLQAASKNDIALQQKLQSELLRTKDARDKVAQSIINTAQTSTKAQTALKSELGLIEKLRDRLNDLKRARESATSQSQIADYNKAITDTQKQLSSTMSGGGGGIIGQLLGLGSGAILGRQVLQGTLYAFGIGSGFGLITRLTDAVVKYGEELIDTAAKEAKFEEETTKLTDTILKQIDAFAGLDNSYQNIYGDSSVNNLKRQLETIKAIGVVNGQIYNANKESFDKKQQIDNGQLSQLNNTISVYEKVQNVLNNGKDIKDVLSNPAELGAGLNTDALKQISKTVDDAQKDGIDLSSAVTDKLIKLREDAKDKSNQIEADRLKFQSDINRQIFELNEKMLIDTRKSEEQYNIERLKGYDETAQRIVEIIDLQRKGEIAEVDDQIKEAKRKGIYTTQIEEDYARKKYDINQKYGLQKIEQVKAFVQKYTEIGDKIEKAVISAAPGTLGALIDPSNPDQEKNRELADARNKKILSDFEGFSEQLHQRAIKNNAPLEEIEKELQGARDLVVKQTNENIVKSYEDTYNQLAALAKQNALTQTLNTSLFHDTNIAGIAQGVLTGRISKQRGSFLTGQQQGFKDIDSLTRQRNAIQSSLQAATAYQANLKNNPDLANKTTPEELQKAQNEITSLQDQLQLLDAKIFITESSLKDKRKQFIVEQIDQYASLAEAGVEAYQKIAAAHQQYLDTEIQIQTEKVREAEFIANRGNTAALQEQQKVLDKQNQQKELAAKREIEINDALVVSNTLLTIAKAAVEGGAGAAFTIAAAVIALVAGFAAASVTAQNANTQVQFWKGGYTGDGAKFDDAGTVHKGEFVFNKETTARYRPIFEAIHKGYDPLQVLAQKEYYSSTNTKQDNTALLEKIDGLELAVRQSKTEVHAVQDIHGMAIFTKQAQAREARRFK